MTTTHTILRLVTTFCACVAAPAAAHASGLQVTPVSVTIPDRAGVIWLSNDADTPMRAQIRVFRWRQVNNEDALEPTQDVLASPPFIDVAPGNQQVVRLVRLKPGAATDACETPYRILVDELPAAPNAPRTGIQFRMQYSIPVYVTSGACAEAAPKLTWTITHDGKTARLNVVNSGQTHAQLGRIAFVNSQGATTPLSDGLLGYVLPGASRSFALSAPPATFASGGQFEVMLNGAKAMEPLSSPAAGD